MTDLNSNPELELVLQCARTTIDSESKVIIQKLLDSKIDWSKVIHLALSHKIAPLLYNSLKTSFQDAVPENILIQLKEFYIFNLQNNLFLTNELVSILKSFSKNHIPTIPYKGPVITQSIYGNLGLRQFGDLDIIVQNQHIKSAKELLVSHGYELTWPEIPLSEKQEEAHIRAKYNYQFSRETDGTIIELHWNVTPRYFSFPTKSDWLWQNLEQISFYDQPVFTFTPEDYILILCVHGSNHCWLRLCWICDISEIIKKKPSLRWDKLVDEAISQGSERMLLLGLVLSHELLRTELPTEIWDRLYSLPEVKSLALQTIAKFYHNSWIGSGIFEIPRYHLMARDNIRDRYRYCIELLEPSNKDWGFLHLPESLHFLYYLLRPIRLGIEHGAIPIDRKVNQIFN